MQDKLFFGFGKRLPICLQAEVSECGLACLAMVASYHGYKIDLASLRLKHLVSLKGTTLADLIKIAESLKLAARPIRLEMSSLPSLELPCILHWGFKHFVVLKNVSKNHVIIHDPAVGKRKVSIKEVSENFTGVALELWPNPEFKRKQEKFKLNLLNVLSKVKGLSRIVIQVLIMAFAIELFGLLSPLFLRWVIDQALVAYDNNLLTLLMIGLALLTFIQIVIGSARSWVLMYLSTTLNVQWRNNVFGHLVRLPMSFFQKRHLGDITSRFNSVEFIQNALTSSFFIVILDGFMSVASLIMMYIFSPLLATVVLGAQLSYCIVRFFAYRPMQNSMQEQIIFDAKQNTNFLESVRGIKAIKLFQREELRHTGWLGLFIDQINAGLRLQRLGIGFEATNKLIIGIENITVIWIAGSMVLNGNFSVGMLIAFKAYKDQFDGRISSLVDAYIQILLIRLHSERLSDIVLTSQEEGISSTAELESGRLYGNITISNLYYRYSPQEPMILNGINLEIKEGESVAIVGSSGCGKTTLVNVICGLLNPTSGVVKVGNLEIHHSEPGVIRRYIGVVTQDDVLFAGSIADNIAFFDPDVDQEWVEECAKMAAIHDDIASTPMGYNSLVGDMGTILSGGQKQRVLIARALYKKPSILILDEATSHLDVDREKIVNTAISNLNITRVIIAHRPETIASADRVVRIENGRILSELPGENISFLNRDQPNNIPRLPGAMPEQNQMALLMQKMANNSTQISKQSKSNKKEIRNSIPPAPDFIRVSPEAIEF